MENESCFIIELFNNPAFTAIISSILTCFISHYFQRKQLEEKWHCEEKSKIESRFYNLKIEAYKNIIETIDEFIIRQIVASNLKEEILPKMQEELQDFQFKFNKAAALTKMVTTEDIKTKLIELSSEANKSYFDTDFDREKIFNLEKELLNLIEIDLKFCNMQNIKGTDTSRNSKQTSNQSTA